MDRKLELLPFNSEGSFRMTDFGALFLEDYLSTTWSEMEKIPKLAKRSAKRIEKKMKGERSLDSESGTG